MNETRDRKMVVDQITEIFGDVLAERDALRAEIEHLREAAEAAEVLRTKAHELSVIADGLYDALWNGNNPTDRRTKAWKDHDVASRKSNAAWRDFNNALRNIGLDVCDSNRKSKAAQLIDILES